MKSTMLGLRIAALIFALICVAHLIRVATRVQIIFADVTIPLWPSLVAALATGALAAWLWSLSRPGPHAHG